jgi:broad specificity phosphatase PhoE
MAVELTYFVHGTTTDNEQDLATGWLPGKLSRIGRDQAKKLGAQIKKTHFAVVFCSDLRRAIDSAELGFGSKYEVIQDQRLRECNYGDLNGRSAAQVKDRLEEYINMPFPHGESYYDVEVRVAGFLDFLRSDFAGERVGIVAHQGPQLALDVLIKSKTWEQAIKEDWRNTKAWQLGWSYLVQ